MSIDVIVYEQKGSDSRTAMLDNGRLSQVEINNEKKAREGSVYLGKITHKVNLVHDKVGFFVNINDTREAFINAEEAGLDEAKICEGQSLVVQVSQEQRAEKGARLSRSLQFVGEYVVYRPYCMNVEVSAKIEDRVKAEEYRNLAIEHTTGQEGWVLRTASVTVPFETVAAEMEKLRSDYDTVLKKARTANAPALLTSPSDPLAENINRNRNSLSRVVVNSHHTEKELQEKFGEELDIVYSAEPFKEFGLDDALLEALQKTVSLPSGGRIIIEETRACVVIDVDSGDDRANGGISRLNSEAAAEIVRQIKLRNLAGKIIIDFAGSSEYKFLRPVLEILEAGLADDYVKSSVLGLSRGGNVEIVRHRRRPTLADVMTVECSICHGAGRVEK